MNQPGAVLYSQEMNIAVPTAGGKARSWWFWILIFKTNGDEAAGMGTQYVSELVT